MMEKTMATMKLTDGTSVEYFSTDCTYYGDYADSGSVGVANVRYLEENFGKWIVDGNYGSGELALEWSLREDLLAKAPIMVRTMGMYGTVVIWFRADIMGCKDVDLYHGEYAVGYDIRELLEGLDDYPCFDDELVSEVEIEWEGEAWESYVRHDLLRTLDDDLQEFAENLDDGILMTSYRIAMEETNTYPVPECSGSYIDIDRIKNAFADEIKRIKGE